MSAIVTHHRVKGADGRLVSTFSPTELHEFKRRIRHSVQHGHHLPSDASAIGERHPATIAAETFTVLPLNADGVVCGRPETWRADP